MRMANYVMTAALAAGLSATAMAQTPSSPPPPAQTPAPSAADTAGATASHWMAAGFVGSSFGTGLEVTTRRFGIDVDTVRNENGGSGVDFGAQLAYLWRGIIGPELLANWAPRINMSNVFLADDPRVHSVMLNALAALPLGAQGRFQPYLSGGFGSMTMKADVLGIPTIDVPLDFDRTLLTTTSVSRSKLGSDIGGGVMGFVGKVGFRGDVRYFHAGTVDTFATTTEVDQFTESLLSGLHFWRANAGIAFLW
jgi:hypothetical protein